MYTCSRESATSDMQTVSGKVSIEFNTEGTSARRMIAFVFLACLPLPSLSREKLPLSVDQSDMSKMLAVDFEVFGVVQGNVGDTVGDRRNNRLLTAPLQYFQGVFFRKVSAVAFVKSSEIRRSIANTGRKRPTSSQIRAKHVEMKDLARAICRAWHVIVPRSALSVVEIFLIDIIGYLIFFLLR